jgi:hypothetical protein
MRKFKSTKAGADLNFSSLCISPLVALIRHKCTNFQRIKQIIRIFTPWITSSITSYVNTYFTTG